MTVATRQVGTMVRKESGLRTMESMIFSASAADERPVLSAISASDSVKYV